MKKIIFLILIQISFYTFSQNLWKNYTQKADSLESKLNFEEALHYREKALNEAAKINSISKDTLAYLKLLKNIVTEEINLKHKKLRKESYKKLKSYIKKLPDFNISSKQLVQVYRRQYRFAHNYMRDFKETAFFVDKTIAEFNKLKKIDTSLYVILLHTSGVINRELEKFDQSIKSFHKLIDIYTKNNFNGNKNTLGAAYLDLSALYDYNFLNIPRKRKFYLKKAEQIFTSIKNPNLDYLVGIYIRLGVIEKDEGNIDTAIKYYKKGYVIYLKNKDKMNTYRMAGPGILRDLQYHSYLIQLYAKSDNETKIKHHLNEVKQLIKTKTLANNERDFLIKIYLFTARFYAEKDKELAYKYLNKGIETLKKGKEEKIINDLDLERVKLKINESDYQVANQLLEKIINNKPRRSILKNVYLSKINLNSKLKDSLEMVNYSLKLINLIHSGKDSLTADNLLNNFKPSIYLTDTKAFLKTTDYLKSSGYNFKKLTDNLYWLALNQFDANFNDYKLNEETNTLFLPVVSHFLDKLSQNEIDEKVDIYSFLWKVESKELLNSFYKNNYLSKDTSLKKWLDKESLYRSKITFLNKKLTQNPSDSLQKLIFENDIKLKRILDTISSKKQGFKSFKVSYKNNLEYLKNDYIIQYKVINNTLYRIVFHHLQDNVTILNNYHSIKTKINDYLTLLKDPTSKIKELKKFSKELYDILLNGISFNNNRAIYIIPDDILFFLPFETLIQNEKYLIENHPVSYAHSLAFVVNPLKDKTSVKEKNVAVFSPSYKLYEPNADEIVLRGKPYYLQGAIDEANAISKIIKSDLFIKEKATKSAFSTISNNYNILHLSMHSFLNDKNPELNSLAFSDTTDDYELHISELYGLNLNADLAVLSACNTGYGKLKTGKGLVAMNTAFISSGVPSVISGLWQVPDKQTKEIMVLFYKNLKKGLSKNKALQKAKLSFLNDKQQIDELKHPYYWAGFVLYGDASKIEFTSNYHLYIFGIAVLILFIVLLYLFRKKHL